MQEIERQISRGYGIDIKSIHSFRDVFIIESSCGKKVLRKLNLSPGRINFIHEAKEHLVRNNFKNVDRYICTKDNEPYMFIDGVSYTVSDYIEGCESDFEKREDIIKSSTMLAKLHVSSRGFIAPKNCVPRDDLGKLPIYFTKRLEEMKRIKKIAQREKRKIDYLVLEYIDYFHDLGEDALKKLYASKYSEVVRKTRAEGLFCHHDYTHSNIIKSVDSTYITNFNYCCFELRVYDIANLLRRKMRKCNWNVDEAQLIMSSYSSVESISLDEFSIMKIILQFPQKFWRVINKYYNSRRTWRERNYYSKFYEAVEEIDYHRRFMNDFQFS
ncbi:MAG: CotS family spore coat protein [Clostridiaceae bacterium]|nr:CotS family spore coat protein [Clostridiaceae bacterium]